MINTPGWFDIKYADQIDSPALIIYKDRVVHNISVALAMVDDQPERLRPHVKTHKTREVTQLLLQKGITKFKCATISEAEMLAMGKAPDVLLAYQPVGPKLQRFISLIERYPQTIFSCLIDNYETVVTINNMAAIHHLNIKVYLDINAGMNRTGISINDKALQLYLNCTQLDHINIEGLHIYDGHIRMEAYEERKAACDKVYQDVLNMQNQLLTHGIKNVKVIIGGSPAFSIHATRHGVECSPGTFVFWDSGYLKMLPEQKFLPAAIVLTRVISVINEELICIDLGHKAIAAENPLSSRVRFLNDLELQPVSQSEEHMVLKERTGKYKIGDLLYALPDHICPTVALYHSAIIIQDHVPAAEWEIIARNRKITI